MKTITTIGVAGAGTMGSALAQKFAQEGFAVTLVDRAMTFVEKGLAAIDATLREGVERRVFGATEAEATRARITGSESLDDLAGCDLVVEAIFEDFSAKCELLAALGRILSSDAIVATNTSSFSVSELAHAIPHPERFIGLHYFYHAAKNRLVEIVPGEKTSQETLRAAQRFAAATGKDPIVCRDRHGFVVNRFFVPWLNEAARLRGEHVASAAAIDAVCAQTFGVGMGPFALMNATGVPIAYHSQRTLERFGTLYAVADALRDQASANAPWPIEGASTVQVAADVERRIRERMLGVVFLVCCQILDEAICTPVELDRGARIGLQWRRGPIAMMRSLGRQEVERLMRMVATRYQTPFPHAIAAAFEPLTYVTLRRAGRSAIITFERPESLNALDEEIVEQLGQRFDEAERLEGCDTIVLTGSGKAFVAGADIGMFLENMRAGTIDRIVEFTAHTQAIFDRIDRSPRHVVAALNGTTLGGGLELALCADTILALPTVRMGFPETGIGIYPGVGGTQRTQRRVGKGLTKYLIYTGDLADARAAAQMGLIDGVITQAAYFELLEGAPESSLDRRDVGCDDARWSAIDAFFERHALDRLFEESGDVAPIAAEELDRWRKRVRAKAPIAMRAAERLVDDARGPDSELEYLPSVFGSRDALIGLSSVGRAVTFTGA
jgi:enoyl-CoA hydratase/3-hydroxyacyl-CoA dehydrogenase